MSMVGTDRKRVLSTLCYVRKAGQTLMLHRVKKDRDIHEGKWNGLGGKFQQGESPEDCVIREVREESGLILKHPMLRGVMTFPAFSENDDWVVFLFTATEFDGTLKASEEGELEWIEDDKVQDLKLWEGDKYFLDWLKRPNFFSAKFVYQDKKLVDHSVSFYD